MILEIKPSKASGIIYHLRDDAELLRSYADQLNEMMDVSSYYKDLYDRTIDGPSKALIKDVRRSSQGRR